MAFSQQNADGTVEGANSYVSVQQVRDYWADRGVDLAAKTDAEIQIAAIKATDFLDARYSWVGYKLYRLQGTQWPRGGVSSFLRGLPDAIINATCSLAQRVLSGKVLMPDPTVDPSGQAVLETTKKVGPLETTLKFASATGSSPAQSLPQYPEITLMLTGAELIGGGYGGSVVRG